MICFFLSLLLPQSIVPDFLYFIFYQNVISVYELTRLEILLIL